MTVEQHSLPEILKKLRSNSPEWYAKYVAAYERYHAIHLDSLLGSPPDTLARQQGVCAEQSHHLRILKIAL